MKYITKLAINDKSVDGVLGTRTRGDIMVDADESTELWWRPLATFLKCPIEKVTMKMHSFVKND